MPVSRPCEQCGAVKRCRMYLDAAGVTYLCGSCAAMPTRPTGDADRDSRQYAAGYQE